ncbi:hypothetical protein AVEN_251912-1 [Araneus ventricosus]|uniref:ISXO2-like transposase domain-containing protein n=1 Tax=Araneus ventricosus TaxID=182803 RepID=A0A4Y2H0H8_ARAVE|nr:hypothetical protein AVEN_251912-1 [Araneus ventricosus]
MIAKEYACPTCGEKMVLTERDGSDDYSWVCRKFGVNAHHFRRTVRKGSWFDESKLSTPEPGSTVLSDCWGSYNGLTAEGYLHNTVNHSKNFKDPVKGVHTNGIEGTWSAIKADFRKQGTKKVFGQFDTYLAEYMWRRSFRGASMKSIFLSFIRGITKLYPPQTQDPVPGK